MGRGFTWLDTVLMTVCSKPVLYFNHSKAPGLDGCVAGRDRFKQGWVDAEQVLAIAQPLLKSEYGHYLVSLVKGGS